MNKTYVIHKNNGTERAENIDETDMIHESNKNTSNTFSDFNFKLIINENGNLEYAPITFVGDEGIMSSTPNNSYNE